MTKEFIDRIMRERIVDTRNYRYVVSEVHNSETQWAEIKRLPLNKLDTTSALTDWETVKKIY